MQNNYINKKAKFNYELIDKYIAGILLTGTEIKSIRLGKISFNDSYCQFDKNELFIKKLHISEYEKAFVGTNHDILRSRKLLLTKKELNKLKKKVDEKGLTIVPVRIFIDDKGWAKMEISLARGKNKHNKKDSIKNKDIERDTNRILKQL